MAIAPEQMIRPRSFGQSPAGSETALPGLAADSVLVIPDYELMLRIGAGAYGDVWLARNLATGTLRAAKIVWRRTFEDERPYQREFEGIQKFESISKQHPNQLALFHIGRNDAEKYFYYVMELADDLNAECKMQIAESAQRPKRAVTDSYIPRTLRAELRQRGRLPVHECTTLGLSLTSALEHLHKNGLVHRDIKPSNIIFVNGVPKLADVGLVADMSEAKSFVGTAGYIPAEGPGTPQADIYSLGKVLYEMSTGRDRQDFPQLPPDLREFSNAAELVEFNEVLLKACDAEPGRRYQSVGQMSSELNLLHRGDSVKHRRTLQHRLRVCQQIGLVGVLLALLATLGTVGLHYWQSKPIGSILPASTDHEATILYDQARRIVDSDDYQKYRLAWSNLTFSVQVDPSFTAAYALMSRMVLGHSWALHLENRMLTLRQLASRLMALDNRLAESQCTQSAVQFFDWDFDKAEESIRRAIQLNPNYWLAHTLHGYYLCWWGHAEKSRRELQIAEKMEPAYAMNHFMLGMSYYLQRDYEAAARQFDEALRLNDRLPWARYNRGRVDLAKHDYPQAIEEFRKAEIGFDGDEPKATERARLLRAALDQDGERGYWKKCLELEQLAVSPDSYQLACFYARLVNKEKAIDWLKKSIHTRQTMDGGPIDLQVDECWDEMRADPEFKKLLAEMKFPP
jgi:serine/threonine protein kinase/Flp pilus assembly protein TadD